MPKYQILYHIMFTDNLDNKGLHYTFVLTSCSCDFLYVNQNLISIKAGITINFDAITWAFKEFHCSITSLQAFF